MPLFNPINVDQGTPGGVAAWIRSQHPAKKTKTVFLSVPINLYLLSFLGFTAELGQLHPARSARPVERGWPVWPSQPRIHPLGGDWYRLGLA